MKSELTQNVLSGIASSEAVGSHSLVLVPYSETLLAKAQELITKGDFTNFSIAVVVAHMACEMC
jgi:hypothetical protein